MQIFRVILAEVSSWIVLCTCVQSPSIWNHNFISRPLLSSILSTIHDKIAPLEKHLTILLSTIQFLVTRTLKEHRPLNEKLLIIPLVVVHLHYISAQIIFKRYVHTAYIQYVYLWSPLYKWYQAIIASYFCDEFIYNNILLLWVSLFFTLVSIINFDVHLTKYMYKQCNVSYLDWLQ